MNCFLRPRSGVLHIPPVVSSLNDTQELTEIILKKDYYCHQLYADGTVSFIHVSGKGNEFAQQHVFSAIHAKITDYDP